MDSAVYLQSDKAGDQFQVSQLLVISLYSIPKSVPNPLPMNWQNVPEPGKYLCDLIKQFPADQYEMQSCVGYRGVPCTYCMQWGSDVCYIDQKLSP